MIGNPRAAWFECVCAKARKKWIVPSAAGVRFDGQEAGVLTVLDEARAGERGHVPVACRAVGAGRGPHQRGEGSLAEYVYVIRKFASR